MYCEPVAMAACRSMASVLMVLASASRAARSATEDDLLEVRLFAGNSVRHTRCELDRAVERVRRRPTLATCRIAMAVGDAFRAKPPVRIKSRNAMDPTTSATLTSAMERTRVSRFHPSEARMARVVSPSIPVIFWNAYTAAEPRSDGHADPISAEEFGRKYRDKRPLLLRFGIANTSWVASRLASPTCADPGYLGGHIIEWAPFRD